MPSDPCIIESLKHKCFLEELLFWTIKYEFPQKMVTFLLNMLPDQDYKVFSLTWLILFKILWSFFCLIVIYNCMVARLVSHM